MSDTEIFFPEGKELKMMGKVYVIKPFVLLTRMKFLSIVIKAFKEATLKNDSPEEIANKLTVATKFIAVAGEKIIDIYVLVLNEDKEFLGTNMTMKDEVKVIKAIFDVNDFPFLVSEIQEMIQFQMKTNKIA